MSVGDITVATWNVEWAPPRRRERIIRRIAELGADILCITEGDCGILPEGGHAAEGGADWGYGAKGEKRKVLLWSRWPLDGIDRVGAATLPPGRFVAATSRTPLGPVRVVGVCVPWTRAHVADGRRDRVPWEDHLTYLERLGPLLRSSGETRATLVLGDFNQRIPRTRQPIRTRAPSQRQFRPRRPRRGMGKLRKSRTRARRGTGDSVEGGGAARGQRRLERGAPQAGGGHADDFQRT